MNNVNQSGDPSFVRLAARLCLIGAVVGVVSASVTGFIEPAVADDRYSYPYTPKGFVVAQLVFLLNHVLLLVGIIGLSRSGAEVPGALGRSGLRIAVAGMGLLSLCEVRALTLLNVGFPSPPTDFLDIFFGIASIMIGVGLVMAGVSVARARRWTGWHRFTPLACGAAVFVIVMPALFGSFLAGRLAIGIWMLLFGALALSMRAEASGPSPAGAPRRFPARGCSSWDGDVRSSVRGCGGGAGGEGHELGTPAPLLACAEGAVTPRRCASATRFDELVGSRPARTAAGDWPSCPGSGFRRQLSGEAFAPISAPRVLRR